MTIPFFLDSTQVPFNYTEIYGITDVETGGVGIITTFRAQAVTGLGWTEPSAALFKTPVDAASRWFDVLLTRISATVLEFRMRNSAGTTITTRRIQITSGFAVRFFTNTMGFLIEALQADPASSETLQGHMLDQSPNLQSDVSNYVVMGGRRSNTSTDDGSGNIVGNLAAIDNGTPAFVAGRLPSSLNPASAGIALLNSQQSVLLRDLLIHINQAGTIRWSGRICHALQIDSGIPPGSDRAVKIDTSTTATYRVTGNPLFQTVRMCMRKS